VIRKECQFCSNDKKKVYHYEGCPYVENSLPYLWLKDNERPIEKADRYLIRSGLEKHGAKGWI